MAKDLWRECPRCCGYRDASEGINNHVDRYHRGRLASATNTIEQSMADVAAEMQNVQPNSAKSGDTTYPD
ncbi:hypothetical protein SHL15_0136 [Streptomyces hygroscopicus subsp. limoneus]|nr:hypothetical protein SHL15_0136 [Streptomyces hygroscopicus subsp. limoneus]